MNSQTLRGPFGWSLASIAVILVFCIYAVFTVATIFLHQDVAKKSASKTVSLVEKYNHYVGVDIARFNGRSAFFNFIPIAPPPAPKPEFVEAPEPEEIITDPVVDSGPPPAPPIYTGPDLIAVIGDEAWFRGSGSGPDAVIRLKAGEERDGLKVVKTTPPAMVIVEHRRGEYPLNLFSSEEPFFQEEAPPVTQDTFLEEVEG